MNKNYSILFENLNKSDYKILSFGYDPKEQQNILILNDEKLDHEDLTELFKNAENVKTQENKSSNLQLEEKVVSFPLQVVSDDSDDEAPDNVKELALLAKNISEIKKWKLPLTDGQVNIIQDTLHGMERRSVSTAAIEKLLINHQKELAILGEKMTKAEKWTSPWNPEQKNELIEAIKDLNNDHPAVIFLQGKINEQNELPRQ